MFVRLYFPLRIYIIITINLITQVKTSFWFGGCPKIGGYPCAVAHPDRA